MSHSLNAALVGYGFAGKTFHAPFLSTTPGLSLELGGEPGCRQGAGRSAQLPGRVAGTGAEPMTPSIWW